MAELYRKYWKPLYHYLRCRGYNNDKAKDLVQGFFTDKVLGQEFIQRADRSKGKFRTFLLIAAKNYALNVKRRERIPQKSDDESSAIVDPEDEFNRAWAQELLSEVLKELEAECDLKGKTTHWEMFKAWLLEPAIESSETQMSDICAKYGVERASQAYNMISNIKKRFRAILRSHLRLLVVSDAEVNGEIACFIKAFSKNTARF